VRFWDTSAIAPLLVTEPATAAARRLLDQDPTLFVWWATRTECFSALARLRREGRLRAAQEQQARRALLALASTWSEVLPSERLRRRAERLLATHALRAGDAFQLAAALLCARGDTARLEIVSLDDRLRAAASREGFPVLP
jgi:predicted nucleic acid-binding protein